MSSIASHVFCTKCGTQAPADSLFCTKCGNHLINSDAAPLEAATMPQEQPQSRGATEGGPSAITPRAIIQAIAGKIDGMKPQYKLILGCWMPYFLWAKPFDSITRQIKKKIIIGWVLVIAVCGIGSVVGDFITEKSLERRMETMSPEERARYQRIKDWEAGKPTRSP